MNTPKLHELAVACKYGAYNPHGIIRSLSEAIKEVPHGKCPESADLKMIVGQLSFLLGETLGPSEQAMKLSNN
jgi:hypothetical protein